MREYVIEQSRRFGDVPSCLPVHLDKSRLRDVTSIADPWRVYMDTSTGQVHDGSVYFKQMQEAQSRPDR